MKHIVCSSRGRDGGPLALELLGLLGLPLLEGLGQQPELLDLIGLQEVVKYICHSHVFEVAFLLVFCVVDAVPEVAGSILPEENMVVVIFFANKVVDAVEHLK